MLHRRLHALKSSAIQLISVSNSSTSSTQPHHYILGGFTSVLLIIVYIAINTPSASTATGGSEFDTEIHAHDPAHDKDENIVLSLADPHAIKSSKNDSTVQSVEILNVKAANIVPEKPEQPTAVSIVNINNATDNKHALAPSQFIETKNSNKTSAVQVPTPDPLTAYLDSQPWTTSKVGKGDTLSELFNRVDLGSREAYQIASLEKASALLKIRPGDEIFTRKTSDGKLGQLKYPLSDLETLLLTRTSANDQETNLFDVELITREPEIRINNARAIINHTLLGSATEAGVSYKTIYKLIAMLGWQVDFSMDLRKGDQFSIIYEELFLDGEKIGDGDIIAAELIVSGKKLQAVRHIDEDGFVDFFAPNGDGIKGTFLRSPLKFGHITSNFSKSRLHPIQKVWKAHKGVDYGAPRGTPVMATGDGTIALAGRKGGYGKTVVIRHGGKYETLYAHLSGYAKGIKSGARVSQGDIIGYVGRTGLATGNHLHYEFRIHGIHKNPVTVEFPKSSPIADKYRSQFQQLAGVWISELDYLNRAPVAKLSSY